MNGIDHTLSGNKLSIQRKPEYWQNSTRRNVFVVKRPFGETAFGEMAFRENGFRSNGVRLNGFWSNVPAPSIAMHTYVCVAPGTVFS